MSRYTVRRLYFARMVFPSSSSRRSYSRSSFSAVGQLFFFRSEAMRAMRRICMRGGIDFGALLSGADSLFRPRTMF